MLITLNDEYPVFDPSVRLIGEFKALLDRDKSKDKDVAIKELAFVYFIEDYKSPFMNVPNEVREQEIIGSLKMGDKWKQDTLVFDARKRYATLRETKAIKLLKAAGNSVDKLICFLNEVDLKEKDEYGKYVYKAGELMKNLKDVGEVAKELRKLEEEVKKDEDSSSGIRGGGKKGLREDPR